MTVQDVAMNLAMSWNTIKEIHKKYLKRRYDKPSLKGIRLIAIDEFAVQKGHKYMTVVYDIEQGRAVYVAQGRESESLKKFWKRLKLIGSELEAVAMDMWKPYILSVWESNLNISIVFDKFHIIRKMNEILDEIRRLLYKSETILDKQKVMKGLRWLLLKSNHNLDEVKNEKQRLEEALKINKPLAQAYYLKEDLQQIWEQTNEKEAEEFLGSWVQKAMSTKIPPLIKFCNMLLSHRRGIFNWYKYKINTGCLEGFNNKIKVLKRKAYGFRDTEYFKLKIYSLHNSRYVLL